MPKVLLFGTFDIIHDGHRNLFKQAAKYGELYVILARDKTIEQVKKRAPYYNEKQRLEHLQQEPFIKQVYLGSLTDKFIKIKELAPDTVFLGYDQQVFVDKLHEKIREFGLTTTIIRGIPYKEKEFKSSLIRSKQESTK